MELGLKQAKEGHGVQASDDDLILAGAFKIKCMYDRADENDEVSNTGYFHCR